MDFLTNSDTNSRTINDFFYKVFTRVLQNLQNLISSNSFMTVQTFCHKPHDNYQIRHNIVFRLSLISDLYNNNTVQIINTFNK